jgi:diguanylate cyclase (GGDEF)-like protein/PAS domain S-box-containing protein
MTRELGKARSESLLQRLPSEIIRVLLIEDNPGYSEVIQMMLGKVRGARFDVVVVERLSDGLQCLGDQSVDVILVDLKLPDSHGINTFDKVHEQAPDVPIIVLTVTDNDELAFTAVQKGAQDYLVKNQVDARLLVRAIRYAIERKRMDKMLLNAAQEWRATFDGISDFLSLIDTKRKIVRCNKAMTQFLNKSFADILGRNCCDFVHGTSEPFKECPFERMRETHSSEVVIVQRGSQWFRISVDPLLDKEGNLLGGVHIMSNITKDKEVDRMKSELISNVSHELRTPLSTIQEGIALMFDETLGPIQEEQKDMLARVKNNIDRLARLINDLLDMSKVDEGKLELQKSTVNITALAEEVFSSFRKQAHSKKIQLKSRIQKDIPPLNIDPDRITQVLTNIIANSVKFTSAHGCITLEIKDKEQEVEIIVTDTGIGIARKNITGLFDRFSQFNRVYGPGERGTGLGLPISKEIVEMHGGRIWVESEVGKGSTITFSLPRLTQDEIFHEYLTTGLREAVLNDCPLSLVVIRVKNMEKVIKTYSDTQVFAVLRETEELIAKTLRRKSDIVSRYKYGEIIIAILMDTSKNDALFVRKRIRQEIETEMHEKGWPKDIELFLDVVTFPEDAANEMELINKIAKGLWVEETTEQRAKGGTDE